MAADACTLDALGALETRIGSLITKEISRKEPLERRWLDDVRQMIGTDTAAQTIREANKGNDTSKQRVQITRSMTNISIARLTDIVLPLDEKNWGIRPDQEPEIIDFDPASVPPNIPVTDPETGQQLVDQETNTPVLSGDVSAAISETSRDLLARANAMQAEIDSQLTATRYIPKCRDAIFDSATYGTGILKGPVVRQSEKIKWKKKRADGIDIWYADIQKDSAPNIEIVSPWHAFPDSDATTWSDAGYMLERHMLNKRQVVRHAKMNGWSREDIEQIVISGPTKTTVSTYMAEYRAITGQSPGDIMSRYELWEYTGTITYEEALTLIERGLIRGLKADGVDYLYDVKLWWIEGKIVRAQPLLLDTGEFDYQFFCWDRDPTCIFGFGVPYQMRHSQDAATSAWRHTLTNAGLSAVPQIIVDEDSVEPADGIWEIRSGKVWKKKRGAGQINTVFDIKNIESRTEELLKIYEVARQNAYEETSQPPLVRGEGARYQTDRVGGMMLLQNNMNISDRRRVKDFDDDLVIPLINKFVSFNMLYSKKDGIKSDQIKVHARGSSELMLKQMKSANASYAVQNAMHPLLGAMHDPYKTLANAYRFMQFDPGDFLLEESKARENLTNMMKSMKENPPKSDAVEAARIRAETDTLRMQHEKELAQMEHEAKLMGLAMDGKIKLTQAETNYLVAQMKDRTLRQSTAAEINLKKAMGQGI